MKKLKFQSPTGMHDILQEDQGYYKKLYEILEEIAEFYGFNKIDTPILEDTELFSKGIGLATDIVEKQMFTLRTKGGDLLTLRPEGTAPVVRAFIEHGMQNLPQPIKLWYFGPFFRYEHPQAGRFRQFWQGGFEQLGEENPVADAQIIQIFYNIFKELKFKDLIVEVNSIGDSQCRPYYKKLLVNYFRTRESGLCPDCKRRLRENPLRVLDCKEEKCQPLVAQAPQLIDHLCEECHRHFKETLEFLDEIELPYRLNPHLVRGLDYYTKTVFEIFSTIPDDSITPGENHSDTEEEEKDLSGGEEKKEEIQTTRSALGGGGRYDVLVKLLGGRDTPAVGGAIGVERIINAMKSRKLKFKKTELSEVYLAQLGNLAKRKSLKLMEEFRKANIRIVESLGRDSLKAQLKGADRMEAKYTLILGQREALDGTIIIKDMQSGRQEIVKIEKAVREIQKKIKK